MIGELRKKYPILYNRYYREVQAHPEGAVVHEGDCGLYNVDLQICTCGLHHMLMRCGDDAEQIYPKYFDEQEGRALVYSLLDEKETTGLWALCRACDGTGGLAMITCEACDGKGLVLFKMPPPISLSEEEIIEQFKKASWQEHKETQDD